MDHDLVFEAPLNERIRLLLRLEALFRQFDSGTGGTEAWHSRLALSALFDLLELCSRTEPRTEIGKELERLARVFNDLRERPGVDTDALLKLDQRIEQVASTLPRVTPAVLEALRKHPFLNAVRQRSGIPGGNCSFDLPELHHWLRQTPPTDRSRQLDNWLEPLLPLRDGSGLILDLLRGSAVARRRVAEHGLYQQSLEGDSAPQLLRLFLPSVGSIFPEISGGRHRFTIRFMHQSDPDTRPLPVDEGVEFRLACCVL
jgi:cell division protein ZapD